jgi:hypothetical protein
LHISGALALAVPSMGATLSALLDREHGQRVITLDPNPRPTLGADLTVLFEQWLPRADIVKVSEDDLAFLCPGEPASAVARRWLGSGASLVVVTRGADGVYALASSESVELPAPPVDLVDTVGAGDAFMSGLLAALSEAGRLSPTGLRGMGSEDLAAALRPPAHGSGPTRRGGPTSIPCRRWLRLGVGSRGRPERARDQAAQRLVHVLTDSDEVDLRPGRGSRRRGGDGRVLAAGGEQSGRRGHDGRLGQPAMGDVRTHGCSPVNVSGCPPRTGWGRAPF